MAKELLACLETTEAHDSIAEIFTNEFFEKYFHHLPPF